MRQPIGPLDRNYPKNLNQSTRPPLFFPLPEFVPSFHHLSSSSSLLFHSSLPYCYNLIFLSEQFHLTTVCKFISLFHFHSPLSALCANVPLCTSTQPTSYLNAHFRSFTYFRIIVPVFYRLFLASSTLFLLFQQTPWLSIVSAIARRAPLLHLFESRVIIFPCGPARGPP